MLDLQGLHRFLAQLLGSRQSRRICRAEAEQARAEAAKADGVRLASLAATQALSENDDTSTAYEEAAARAETAASACS